MAKRSYIWIVRGIGGSAACLGLLACGGSSGSKATVNPPPATFSGSYVFSVVGTDPTDGDYSVVGSLVADGKGNISSAVADYNLGSGIDANVPLTGTYTLSGNLATINLTDGGAINDSFMTTLGSSGGSKITSYDGTGDGTLYPQVTTGFNPAGTFNVTVAGEGQGTVTGTGNFVAASSGTFTGGTLTYQDALTSYTYSPITGFLYPPQPSGRGQAAVEGINAGYYVISPKQIAMIGLDDRALLNIQATEQ